MSDKIESKEELIKTGVLRGREALEWLDKNGSYVYHGSPDKIDRLEPRQEHTISREIGKRIKDGEPTVATSDKYEYAIFMAVLNKKIRQEGDRSGVSIEDDGLMYFRANKGFLEQAKMEGMGYVYVLNRGEFKHYKGPEFRANHEVKPVFVVKVGFDDLPKDIKIVEPAVIK